MKQDRGILGSPLIASLLATAFCLWIALGNDVNLCVTTGCTLYQDLTFFGVSLWWYGAGAFGALAFTALFGLGLIGTQLAALFVLCDLGFLAVMLVTAPCVNCLVAAAFFALIYLLFRRYLRERNRTRIGFGSPHSILLWVWLAFFVVNLGAVAKSQFDVWPILNDGGEAKTRMFFSPTCKHCIEGVNALSGNVDVAFYPVGDNDDDVYRVRKMRALLDDGQSMAEALGASGQYETPGFFGQFSPSLLILRFRMLRNKAHIFAANSQGVPFFEIRGLPGDVKARAAQPTARPAAVKPAPIEQRNLDPTLPIDNGNEQCLPGKPCE